MEKSKYHTSLQNLVSVPIAHGSALKKVFISNEETSSALTQFAWSIFKASDSCESHSHLTMDEYFFVHEGSGTYWLDDEELLITKGDFLRIPANTPHRVAANRGTELELVYFGIALDND